MTTENINGTDAAILAAAERLREADAVLVGASNGFSITEGLHLFAEDEAFEAFFGDFRRTFGIRCILHGMAADWPDESLYWGFWSRLIDHYSARYEPGAAMTDLLQLLRGKDAFIVTTNGEGHFTLAGFTKDRLYEPEGNWLSMQCGCGCSEELFPTADAVREMAKESRTAMTVSPALVPRCPHCGAPMRVHAMVFDAFLPEKAGRRRFAAFLERNAGRNLVILELGVGMRNSFIKGPFITLAERLPQATYIPVNLSEPDVPAQIRAKTLAIASPIDRALSFLRRHSLG